MAEVSHTHESLPAIIADENEDDYEDSDYSSGTASDTTSLSTSVTRYQYENGRRYHAYRQGNYAFPNDEEEQDRMDLAHHVWRLRFGGTLHSAPIEKDIHRVLDIGTGTGIWAIDFADEFPSAEVIGTDISPIQPRWVPPNVRFEVDDCESPWTYPLNHFDYIHARTLAGSIADWDALLQQAYDHAAPGGWVEFQEIDAQYFSDDGTYPKNDPIREWSDNMNKAARLSGRDVGAAPLLKSLFHRAGFEEVTEKVLKTPSGTWPKEHSEKEIGAYARAMMAENLEGLSLALFTRVLGWDASRVKVLVAAAQKSLSNRRVHLYSNWYSVYGRKPLPKKKGKGTK